MKRTNFTSGTPSLHNQIQTNFSRFRPSAHFLYRQWDRKIDDQMLQPILYEMNQRRVTDGMVVIPINNSDKVLFIKIISKVLITCFIGHLSNKMGNQREENFILSYQKITLK